MGRLFARMYDRVIQGAEDAGLRDWRATLLGRAAGCTLEVGSGTGLNLAHYPGSVTRLVVAEPSRFMREQLVVRAKDHHLKPEVIDAPAEALPFESATFDTVVCTLVLCSVTDLDESLAEMHRVLRPGGRLIYLEHVAHDGGWQRVFQHMLEPVWRLWADGCRLTRSTGNHIEANGFQIEERTAEDMPLAPFFVRPCLRGTATRPE
jgi:ubiquinone/menaquinone biosynthesis C-methylase UbiE